MIRIDTTINNKALHQEDFIFSIHVFNNTFSKYENKTLSIDSQSILDVSFSLNIDYMFQGNVTTSIILDNQQIDIRGGTV